jgi:hypothetical protein
MAEAGERDGKKNVGGVIKASDDPPDARES